MRLKNRKGASSVVEFALILPLFLLLIFGVIDFGYYFFVQQTLQFATREGVRLALTGRTLPTFNREASIIVCITEKASVASLDPARLHVYIYPVTADFKNPPDWSTMECGSAGPDVGGPGDYMRVKTTYAYKFITPFIGPFFPGGEKTMEAQATYRNEQF